MASNLFNKLCGDHNQSWERCEEGRADPGYTRPSSIGCFYYTDIWEIRGVSSVVDVPMGQDGILEKHKEPAVSWFPTVL